MKSGTLYATLYWDGMPYNVNPETLTADVDKVLPIPLTPEILEKNGFKNGKLNVSPQYYLEDNGVFIGVTLKDIPDKHKGIDIAKGRLCFQLDVSRMEEPLYIHQLQHALRLAGIDKEIIL